MKKNSMRLLGFLLVAMMMVSLFAVGVFAEDTANVAKIGDTEYATLQAAINAAKAGDTTITLLRDCGGSVSIKQESGKNITVEGDGNTFSGTIAINGSSRADGAETLTFKNVEFNANVAKSITGSSYAHNVKFVGCKFVTNTGYQIEPGTNYNWSFVDCSVSGNGAFWQARSATNNLYVENFVAENGGNAFKIDYCATKTVTATFKNVEIKSGVVGFYISDRNSGTVYIEDCTVNCQYPVYIWHGNDAPGVVPLVFTGENLLHSTANQPQITGAVGTSYTIEGEETIKDVNMVAQIGDVKYETLQAAINACTNGETVKLIADIIYTNEDIRNAVGGATGFGQYPNPCIIDIGGKAGENGAANVPSSVNAILDLNGHTITSTADAYLFMIMDNAKLTFTDSSDAQTGKVITTADAPVIWVIGTETLVTVEGGFYQTASATGLLHVTHGGDLVVNGGEFKTTADDASLLIMLNTKDRQNSKFFISGKATVTIKGGTYNVDPTHYHGEAHFPMGYLPVKNADGTWTVVEGNVYNKTIGQTFLTIADAMADAMTTEGDDHIILLGNHTESVVLIYNGTTLDLQTYTLKADYLVSFNGGYITGAVRKSSATYAKLIVPKQFVALAENAAVLGAGYVLPVWDKNENAYVFGQLATKTIADGVRESDRFEGKEELFTQFVINGSTYVKKTLMLDQASSGLHVEVVASWNPIVNGIVSTDTITQVYRFSDESLYKNLVENCDLSASVMLDGHENLTMYIRFVSDTGVVVNMGYVSAN